MIRSPENKLPRKEYAFRLARMASSKVPPGEVYNYITTHSPAEWHDELAADELKRVFKRRIEEDGLHLTSAGRIVMIQGDLCHTPSASDVCTDPIIDGHIHPAQSAVPSFGDLDPDRSDVLGVHEMWIARPTAQRGSRMIRIKSRARGFAREELQELSDIKEDLDNGFEYDEITANIMLEMGVTIPIHPESDIAQYEEMFVRNARQAGFKVLLICAAGIGTSTSQSRVGAPVMRKKHFTTGLLPRMRRGQHGRDKKP